MAGEKLFVRKLTKIPALPLPPTVTRPETLAVEVFFIVFVCEYESEGRTAQQENATKTIIFLVRNLIGLTSRFVTCAQAGIIRLVRNQCLQPKQCSCHFTDHPARIGRRIDNKCPRHHWIRHSIIDNFFLASLSYVMAFLKITDASGRQWQYDFVPSSVCSIGRAPDNTVVLDDPRASRYHAHIKSGDDGSFTVIDGAVINGQLRRSANKVFVNGGPHLEYQLKNGDRITIGASTLRFEQQAEERTTDVRYDDKPLGHTQLLISANDVMHTVLHGKTEMPSSAQAPTSPGRDKVLEALQRKANILSALYEMSKTLGSVFDLETIFAKATDIIFRSTPADRVVALLAEGTGKENPEDVVLNPIATRARDESLNNHARKLTIGRTITRKVMKDRVALLSQDAASDEQFAGVDSIVSQGVRSTICAPLVGESRVHGAIYADRLDPFAAFKPDDLELISAVAAQTAVL